MIKLELPTIHTAEKAEIEEFGEITLSIGTRNTDGYLDVKKLIEELKKGNIKHIEIVPSEIRYW